MVEIGTLIADRFEIRATIGRGGMGEIYRVLDRKHSCEVALKRLITDVENPIATQRFCREFEVLSKFDHRNVVHVYEQLEVAGALFYTMEYLPGISLKEWIATAGLPAPSHGYIVEALKILAQLAQALQHVHEHGVIHHDVHPHNVQLVRSADSCEYCVKLIDFGTSLIKEQQQKEEIRVGATNYKSPEHLRGEFLDYLADIYCFGAVAYEVLAREQPFNLRARGINEHAPIAAYAAMAWHVLKEVPVIKGLPSTISHQVNRMIQICMEKEAEHRYQSMQEIVDRLADTLRELASRRS